MKLARKRISVFLAITFLLCSITSVSAKPLEYFVVELQSEVAFQSSLNSSLANVKLDVYESTLDRYDPAIRAYTYAHTYSHSIYTGANGSVRFVKPSSRFLVMVDLATLPSGVGIDKELVFYYDTLQKSDSRSVSTIVDIEVSYDASAINEVHVGIFNAYGEAIKADYTVTPDVIANPKDSVLASTYQISGTVTVGSIVKHYNYTMENSGNKVELVANALEGNRISKEEALDLYLELWESGYSDGFCLTPLSSQIVELYEDKAFVSQLSPSKQTLLTTRFSNVFGINYIDERIFEAWVGNGYLNIHYEGNGIASGVTPQAISEFYLAYCDTYNLFCGTIGFQQPMSSLSSSVYDIYVTTNTSATFPVAYVIFTPGTCTSQMTLRLTHNLSTGLTTDEKAAIDHEYMHSIMNSYKDFNDIPWEQRWIHETFTVWAEARQYGAAGLLIHSGDINEFLRNPSRSFIYANYYNYGNGLLALYMQVMYQGGDATIKKIVERLSYVTSQGASPAYTVFDAIDYGLSFGTYNTSFNVLLPRFWVANYTPHSSYSAYATTYGPYAWDSKPGIAITYNYNALPNNTTYNIYALACHFREFGFDYNQFTWDACVSVTVNFTGSNGASSNLGGAVILTDASGNKNVGYINSSYNMFYTVIWQWEDYVTGCVMVTNNNQTLTVSYKLTIDVHYS